MCIRDRGQAHRAAARARVRTALKTLSPPRRRATLAATSQTLSLIHIFVAQLQNISANPAALLDELNTWVTLESAQVDALSGQVSTDNTNIATLQAQVSNLQNTNARCV